MDVTKILFEKQDAAYRDFTAKLIPTVPRETFIGVRLPDLKALCKAMTNEEKADFILDLPHTYHDENILHALIVSEIRDPRRCLCAVERFLPYISSWSVCDTMAPKSLTKEKEIFIEKIRSCISSGKTYYIRFGVLMLMKYYLNDEFDPEYPALVASVVSDEYYVNMMCAWYFATALAKQYDSVIPYLENKRLTQTVHKMTVRKAVESFRIDDVKKAYLKTL